MNKKHLPISIAIIILILCVVFYLYKKNNDNDDDILSKVSKSLKTALGQTGGATGAQKEDKKEDVDLSFITPESILDILDIDLSRS